jgi:hypothetical protein
LAEVRENDREPWQYHADEECDRRYASHREHDWIGKRGPNGGTGRR